VLEVESAREGPTAEEFAGQSGGVAPPEGAEQPSVTDDEERRENSEFLPPFTDEENRKLDREVQQLQRQLDEADAGIDEHREKASAIQSHLKNVQQEVGYTQSQVDSRSKEAESESHLKMLSERATGKLQSDTKQLKREHTQLQSQAERLQSQIQSDNEKLEQFKQHMNWNHEELKQWAEANLQKEEDNLIIEKYRRADEQKVKDLTLSIEKQTKVVSDTKSQLDAEATETQSAKIQLDKTAEDFRKLHSERQELIRQWEQTFEAIKRRDADIQNASDQLAEKKREVKEKKAELDEQAKLLEREKTDNRETEKKIELASRGVSKLREVQQQENDRLSEAQDELTVVKSQLSKANSDLESVKATNKQLRSTASEKQRKLKQSEQRLANTRERKEKEVTQLNTMEERAREFERLQQEERSSLEQVNKEINGLKYKDHKASVGLLQLQERERKLQAELSGGQAQSRNMTKRIKDLGEQVARKQATLYNHDFQVQQMERKVARARGERTMEEKTHLNERIEELNDQLEEKNKDQQLLSSSTKSVEDDLALAKKKNKELSEQASQLKEKLTELQLAAENASKDVKSTIKEKEEKMMSHDALKLETKKVRDKLNDQSDEIYGLENYKYQLQQSLEEKRQEAELSRDELKQQLISVQKETHRANLELQERKKKAEKLKSKYDVVCGKVAPPDGEQEQSHVYKVIQAAQEREQLQREGDELDAKVKKAEKETQQLEKTLGKLNKRNSEYRQSFRKVSDKDVAAEQERLQHKLDATYDAMKNKREEERQLQQELEQQETSLTNTKAQARSMQQEMEELQVREQRLLEGSR